VKRFIESLRMREIESLIKGKLDDVKSSIEVKQASEILKDQRCVIGY